MSKNTLFIILSITVSTVVHAADYDAGDFATEVIHYIQGVGVGSDYVNGARFNDPSTALGRPTIDTTGDGWNIQESAKVPVVSVYQTFRAHEIVTIGTGGELVLKFDHPVANDKNNPFGIDLIVFGNAGHQVLSGGAWVNGDPRQITVRESMIAEIGIVSVSRNGSTWHTFSDGPYADDFPSTLGRIYDPNTLDASLGQGNLWWSKPTNPTLPLNPELSPNDFKGLTVAQVAQLYGKSAGGTGFDIGQLGLDWIQYVKIKDNGSFPPEIDAISDVSCCGDYKHPFPQGDLNEDCRVNLLDFSLMASNWLICTWNCE